METIFNMTNTDEKLHRLNLTLLYANRSNYDEDWHSILHQHPFTEFMYVTEGKGRLVLQDRSFSIEKDDLLIINSDIKHTEKADEKEGLSYIVLGVEGISLINVDHEEPLDIMDHAFINSYVFSQNYANHRALIRDVVLNIYREHQDKNDFYKEYTLLYLEMLIINILRLSNSKFLIKSNSQEDKQLEYVKSFIDIHYSRDITLEDLAKMIYTSKYHLIKEFKESYGVTPIDYLIERRIETSKYLLTSTDHSIKEIAYIIGMNSHSYFTKVFKSKNALTPSQYRRTRKNRS